MAETLSEAWADQDDDICSFCSFTTSKEGFTHKKTAFERVFPARLREQENRRWKNRRLALSFKDVESESRPRPDCKSDRIDDMDKAISRRSEEVHTLLTNYAKENGIEYVPFLSREEGQLHRLRNQVYTLGTRLLEGKRRELLLRTDQSCGNPRWYKPLSKSNRIARLQEKFLHRHFRTQDQLEKENFALEWHLNYLRFHFLPFFLDPSHADEDDLVYPPPQFAKPQTARKLLLLTLQNHPTRESLFQHLSAYEIAKVFHVLFPAKTKEAATQLVGENQVHHWMNPLRDIFTSKQLEYVTESLLTNRFSRESLVFFGPDCQTLQERLWNVPAHEAQRGSTKHPLRIFFTWSHCDRKRAGWQSFDFNDIYPLPDDIFFSRPGNDGEPHRGLGLKELLDAEWDACDDFESVYGRTLRLGCPDSDLYAEQIWAETLFYWTPSTLQSDIRPDWGTVTTAPLESDASRSSSGLALTLHGGFSHGIPSEVLRLTSRRREDLSPVWDGSALCDVLEIPFVTYGISPTNSPHCPARWEISQPNLMTWNPESTAEHALSSPQGIRRELRRQRWTREIQRTRHFVYHRPGRRWWKQWMVQVGDTVKFQKTFAWMAMRDPGFLLELIRSGEVSVMWVDFSRWFG